MTNTFLKQMCFHLNNTFIYKIKSSDNLTQHTINKIVLRSPIPREVHTKATPQSLLFLLVLIFHVLLTKLKSQNPIWINLPYRILQILPQFHGSEGLTIGNRNWNLVQPL